ncbi:hypothetical protein HRbin04_00732 [archaeon HR04]|mgnify:CR=1 FL=1|nr:hypothetical protein HRbin04_00732 [archaeon HR04]
MNGQVEDVNTKRAYMYDVEAVKVFSLMYNLFGPSIEMKVIRALCVKGSCSLRGLAKSVDIHHTNLAKYIARMSELGIIEWEQVGRTKVIRISSEYAFLKRLFTR